MRAPLLVVASWAGGTVRAADTEVISARPDAVSVTIYRDLFALITETRTVTLPAGPVTLTFEGVVETLLPQSAVVQDLGRTLVERNYRYDPLTPYGLFSRSIGKTVTVTRTLPGTGSVVQARATIVSAGMDGVTFRTDDGVEALYCSGLPEHVTFESMPEMHTSPRLSVNLAAGPAGPRTVRVSYLAHGFAWSSDYVARFAERADRMSLTGWVTLRNLTNATFRDAQVQVVAGRLNLLDAYDGGTSLIGPTSQIDPLENVQSLREERLEEIEDERLDRDELEEMDLLTKCYPYGPQAPPPAAGIGAFPDRNLAGSLQRIVTINAEDISEVIVTGLRASGVVREPLGDYQLYRLPWRTDLNARQTKQALLLHKPDVRVDRFYSYRMTTGNETDEPWARPVAKVAFENRKSAGLGEPLPEGTIRFFDGVRGGDLFAGEARLGDKSVGSPVELALAGALDLTLRIEYTDLEDKFPDDEAAGDVTIGVANAKTVPVSLEIRLALDEYTAHARIQRATHRVGRKFGDYVWRLGVPANGRQTLRFRLRLPQIEDPDE